ncbi:MAG TPA: 3-deoxy-7-phosphoheptulonate synthase [Planctomycetes bacterium]|nr:3-deoxy-7-phosphoheptulonate synthase [Planctomycetota bacterium]
MLFSLRKTPAGSEAQPLLDLADRLGYRARFLGAGRRVLELVREDGTPGDAADRSRFEDFALVAGVLDASDAPERTERRADRKATVVRVGDAVFSDDTVSLIAGPCAVEDQDDLIEIAAGVREAGATLLRGGAFKPRTSPHAFRGLGEAGLEMLVRAREATGLAFVTEVLDPRDVELVAGAADALQIGSRSMSNQVLLREAASSGKPILLKRGLAATVREFLLAAETVLDAGNPNVILCERGVRSFDSVTRNLLDLGAVAHLTTATHLPVIADPSHAAGKSHLVPPLARAALAAGAAGLIVEVHPAPHTVHSDGAQAISIETFAELAAAARAIAPLVGRRFIDGTDSRPLRVTEPDLAPRAIERTAP